MKKYYHIPVKNPETLTYDGYWKMNEKMYNKILESCKEQYQNFDDKKLFVTKENEKIIIRVE